MMGVLDPLIASAGKWVGTNRLQDPRTGIVEASPGTVAVTPILSGRFVRLDYTWVYQGSPQEGSLLIGHGASEGVVTGHWIDTWHMGDKLMSCAGPVDPGGPISVRGSYAAAHGPDWGWRILLTAQPHRLTLVMRNITPQGGEELAVEAEYARASS